MRILCLWDTAGVFVPIAKWLNENGHQARIVMRMDYDAYGQTANSPYSRMVDSSDDFLFAAIDEIRTFKPDLIHMNQIYHTLPLVRLIAPFTPIVFQYHGGDVRERLAKKIGIHSESKLADKIIVSTEDLQEYGEWYDRILSDRFYDRGGRIPNTALMVYVNYVIIDQRQLAKDICEERGLELTIINRDTDTGVPNEEMPAYLSTFEYYLDFKGHVESIILSKIALEALACGCKVIQDAELDLVISDSLQYVRNNASRDYEQLYRKMKRKPLDGVYRLPRVLLHLFTRKGLSHFRILAKYIALQK